METRLLRAFLTLTEELHFGRAAARSGVSQPRLSNDIRKLEQRVGAPLFARTSRRTSLTAAGEAFARSARRALDELDRGIEAARWNATGAQEPVAIAYVSTAMLMGLPMAVREFLLRNPAARLILRELSTVPQLDLLAEGAIDVALTSTVTKRAGTACHRRWRDPLVAVLPDQHEIGSFGREQGPLSLDRLAAEPFVLFPAVSAPELHGEILAVCARAGFAPEVVQEAVGWHSVLSLVAAGMGVTIAPSVVSRLNVPGVRLNPIAGRGQATSVMLCTRRGPLSDSVKSFVDLACALVGK